MGVYHDFGVVAFWRIAEWVSVRFWPKADAAMRQLPRPSNGLCSSREEG